MKCNQSACITQMHHAKLGVITPQMESVAQAEKIDPERTIAIDGRQLDLKQREKSSPFTAYLSYQDDSKYEQTYSIMKTTTFFGTSSKCEFKVGGWFILPRHAMIVRDEMGFRFINFGKSALGTINGQAVDDYRLKNGDAISIGSKAFKFFMGIPSK